MSALLGALFLGLSLTSSQWDDLAQCESSGYWYTETGNGYYGGLQISLETWKEHGGLSIASKPSIASRELQIVVAERILEDQGLDAWPVCSYVAGLR